MSLQFKGKFTAIEEPVTGASAKGEWARVDFEITESEPENPAYPQIGKFDLFKNGEHVKFANEFKKYHKLGDEVVVHFNLKKNTYTNREGVEVGFYKTSAWKVEKLNNSAVDSYNKETPPAPFESAPEF